MEDAKKKKKPKNVKIPGINLMKDVQDRVYAKLCRRELKKTSKHGRIGTLNLLGCQKTGSIKKRRFSLS